MLRVVAYSLLMLSLGVFSFGCAFDLAHVSFEPTQLLSRTSVDKAFILQESVSIKSAPCGYDRTLNQNTKWELVGNIPEGNVYRSSDQVLTVECSNVFEAYLVEVDGFMVAFYLPVEKGIVKLKERIALPYSQQMVKKEGI